MIAVTPTRWRKWLLLLAAAFVVTLLCRLPLAWALAVLPTGVHCEQATGTVWQGHCAVLQLNSPAAANSPLSGATLSWRWLPWRLLRLRLAAEVQLQVAGNSIEALLQRSWGGWELLDCNAQGPLDHRLLPMAPVGWSGQWQLSQGRLRWQSGRLTALDGTLLASDLRSAPPQSLPYGSYRLQMPRVAPGAPLRGELVDLAGPLGVAAVLQISPELAWQLDGTVITRPTAPETLALQLQMLGSADSQGRRSFSVAGQL